MDSRVIFDPKNSGITAHGVELRELYYGTIRRITGNYSAGKYVSASLDGGVSETGRRYSSNVWDKIYKKLTGEKVDIPTYFDYVFTLPVKVSPSNLAVDDLIENYKARVENAGPPAFWDVEKRSVLTRLKFLSLASTSDSDEEILLRVLNDSTIGVSPIVRYAFAAELGKEDMIDTWTREAAFAQFFKHRFLYEKWFADRIPYLLKKRVQEME